jgi:hypothetical protein
MAGALGWPANKLGEVAVERFSTILLIGSALTGLWVAVRLARFTPRSLYGAGALLLSTTLFALLTPSLLPIAFSRLPSVAAAMLGAYPLLVALFAAGALLLRYFALALASRTLNP